MHGRNASIATSPSRLPFCLATFHAGAGLRVRGGVRRRVSAWANSRHPLAASDLPTTTSLTPLFVLAAGRILAFPGSRCRQSTVTSQADVYLPAQLVMIRSADRGKFRQISNRSQRKTKLLFRLQEACRRITRRVGALLNEMHHSITSSAVASSRLSSEIRLLLIFLHFFFLVICPHELLDLIA